MSHTCNFWPTPFGALVCACGQSLRQSTTEPKEETMSTTEIPALTAAELLKVEAFGIHDEPRRTKRRYAHELYPHAEEDEVRPLAVEVPYLLARAQGFEIQGTSWMEAEPRSAAGDRIMRYLETAHLALLADALLQGMAGEEAWTWAAERRGSDNTGEWVLERADHYGVPVDDIKPYPCGPEPDHHSHYDAPDARGWRTSHRIAGKESQCVDCTEPEVSTDVPV